MAPSVDAGIGAAGKRDAQPLAGELMESGLQLSLNARSVLLYLGAAVAAAIVLQQQSEPAQRRLAAHASSASSSSRTMGAPSPPRGPSLMIRV